MKKYYICTNSREVECSRDKFTKHLNELKKLGFLIDRVDSFYNNPQELVCSRKYYAITTSGKKLVGIITDSI